MAFYLGIVTIIIAVVSYAIYIRDVLGGSTKPHGFTWFVWALLNSYIFFQQIQNNAGAGAWVTGVAALANLFIFLLALKYGERNITKLDWACLGLAFVALSIWLFNSDVVLSVVLACSVFVLGFIPTLRKSIRHAREETATTFALNSLKFLVALFALSSVTIVTALYPLVLFVINGLFALFLFARQGKPALRKRRA
jgi:chromate transport protein ChrA